MATLGIRLLGTSSDALPKERFSYKQSFKKGDSQAFLSPTKWLSFFLSFYCQNLIHWVRSHSESLEEPVTFLHARRQQGVRSVCMLLKASDVGGTLVHLLNGLKTCSSVSLWMSVYLVLCGAFYHVVTLIEQLAWPGVSCKRYLDLDDLNWTSWWYKRSNKK